MKGRDPQDMFASVDLINEKITELIRNSRQRTSDLKAVYDQAAHILFPLASHESASDKIMCNGGAILIGQGEYDKALEMLGNLVGREPAFRQAYFNYAVALLHLGEEESATAFFDHAAHFPEADNLLFAELPHGG